MPNAPREARGDPKSAAPGQVKVDRMFVLRPFHLPLKP